MLGELLVTGNEEDESYHYILKNDDIKFYKTIIINHDLNFDYYE